MSLLDRFKGPSEPAFKELISRRPRPRALWLAAYGHVIGMMFLFAFGMLFITTMLLIPFERVVPKSLQGPVVISLLITQQCPMWVNLANVLKTRSRVRQANFLACPNCLFNLSDLTDADRCPECGFEIRALDLPAAWKSVFQWSLGKRSTNQEGY